MRAFRFAFVLLISLFATACATNTPLNLMGLHPHFEAPEGDKPVQVAKKRALVITTSQATLGEGGKATGVFGSEMTAPYYQFLDAGMEVDVASIKGGAIPVDPISFKWYIIAEADQRYLEDAEFQAKVENSLKIDDVDIEKYDIIFIAGGWGAAYDLGYSEVLGDKISQAYAMDKPIGAVCHGPLGLLKAKKPDGSLLVDGLKMTAVTDRQIKQFVCKRNPATPRDGIAQGRCGI